MNCFVLIIEGKYLFISVCPFRRASRCSWFYTVDFLALEEETARGIWAFLAAKRILSNLGAFYPCLPWKKLVPVVVGASEFFTTVLISLIVK